MSFMGSFVLLAGIHKISIHVIYFFFRVFVSWLLNRNAILKRFQMLNV